jgi:predicted ATPase
MLLLVCEFDILHLKYLQKLHNEVLEDRKGEAPILRRIEKSRSGWLFSCAKWWNDRIDGNTKKCLYLNGKAGTGKSICVEVLVFEFDILHMKYLCNLARH